MGNKFMKICLCIATIMVMLSACSRNDSVQAEQNVQVVENDLGLEEKDIGNVADVRQDETVSTDEMSEQRERRKIYEADFDKDGIEEVALIMLGGSGTGVSVERLIIFEPKVESGQVIAYEITGETLQQEIEKIYDFQVDIGNWEVIIKKNDTVEKVIDWGNFSQYYVDGEFQLDYLNQIEYEILDDKIVMNIDVGIWTNKGGPQKYFQNNAGTLSFNVLYENEQFRLE